MYSSQKEERVTCLECQKKFDKKEDLIKHLSYTHNLKQLEYNIKQHVGYRNCKNCNKEYTSVMKNSIFCDPSCRDRMLQKEKEELLKKNGLEHIDYVICQECGFTGITIYEHIKKSHKFSIEEYKNKYPLFKLQSDNYTKSTTVNSGQFMKTDFYKKLFSEKIKGNKNPNHKDNTTLEQRQAISPFSIEFHRKANPNISEEELTKIWKNNVKEYTENVVHTTTLQYYLNKGHSVQDAKELLKERQTTFSLEKCIKKYGQEEGLKKWVERQEKWHNSYKKTNYSKVSQKLFWSFYNDLINKGDIYFAELDPINKVKIEDGSNNEYRLTVSKFVMKPDFIDLTQHKIIEFDGTYYHSETCQVKDRDKDIFLKSINYKILRISEEDYKNAPELQVIKCLEFLNGKRK